tara:strand:- start:3025 stop:3363 length:339 start_codon:yes stop_codon:yes gene_type:complete
MEKYLLILFVAFCAFLGAIGQVLFKLGAPTAKLNFSILTNYHIIFGLVLYALATVLFIYALKFGEVSLLYPVIATSYIWVMLFATIFLGEKVNYFNWFGVFLIISGIYFIVR